MNYVVCLKYGNKYSAEYVNTLYSMVERNLTVPYEFVCYTEDSTGIDPSITIKPLTLISNVHGWWYKPMFFNPDLGLKGTILFLDLDVIVFRNIDNLFTYEPGKFCIIRDFTRFVIRDYKKFNSSVFRLETGQHSQVYTQFIENPKNIVRRFHGDQDWIYSTIQKDFVYWPDEWIQSYKWEMRGKPQMTADITGRKNFAVPGEPEIKPNTNIAVFHGDPNPHLCVDNWCKENWK
jgi:hypothetical protein